MASSKCVWSLLDFNIGLFLCRSSDNEDTLIINFALLCLGGKFHKCNGEGKVQPRTGLEGSEKEY